MIYIYIIFLHKRKVVMNTSISTILQKLFNYIKYVLNLDSSHKNILIYDINMVY